jgi:dethiobiotin synthetase
MKTLIVTGTDTGLGKTMICAMLMLALDAYYWKPIQSGTTGGTDTQRVAALTALPPARFLPERYVLSQALSPHRAAELDGIPIAPETLDLPEIPPGRWLIVEGAGGALVPITRTLLQAALFSRWQAPAIVVARTALGTINHTLMTLEALQRRAIAIAGLIFVGEPMPDTERTIVEFGGVRRLGRLPLLPEPDAASLRQAFATGFQRSDFELADFESVHGA